MIQGAIVITVFLMALLVGWLLQEIKPEVDNEECDCHHK